MGWFGPNKQAIARWPDLTPEDATLCWKVAKCPSSEEFKHINIAIEQKRYDALAEMCKLSVNNYALRQLLVKAYRANDLRALELLASCKSARILHKDSQSVMFDNIVQGSPQWGEGFRIFVPLFSSISANKLVDAIADYDDAATRRDLMAVLFAARGEDTARIITRTLSHHTALFDTALVTMPVDAETPSVLAVAGLALLEGKKIRSAHALDALIEHGMNVNHDRGALLIAALKTNRLAEAQKLIDAGFNLPLLGHGVLEAVYSQSGQPEAVAFIEARVGKMPARTTPAALAEDGGFVLMAPDTVARSLPMPGGGSLTVMFNFTLRQQIVVAQQAGAQVAASAPTVIPFDALGAPDALHAAADALQKLGGDAALADAAQRPQRRLISAKPAGGA